MTRIHRALTLTLLLILSTASTLATAQRQAGDPGSGIQYHPIMDPQRGIVQAVFPYPASWQIDRPGSRLFASGPGGIQIHPAESNQFFWSNDPNWRRGAQQMGTLAPPLPIQQALEQIVRPAARARGQQLISSFAIPEISGFWQRFQAGMPNNGMRRQVEALGSEWRDARGQRTFVAIVQLVSHSPQSLSWQLHTQSLTAPDPVFDRAVTDFRYAVGAGQINPRWQAIMNNQYVERERQNDAFWAEASASSHAAHQQRMAAIHRAGQTALSVGNTYSEILDISHAGHLNRDSIQSAGQSNSIRQISGHAIISNRETGEHYEVEDDGKHYWVNADGLYISTDNPLFDPRLNPEIRHEQWTRFVKQ